MGQGGSEIKGVLTMRSPLNLGNNKSFRQKEKVAWGVPGIAGSRGIEGSWARKSGEVPTEDVSDLEVAP